jgi:hypothetical protein
MVMSLTQHFASEKEIRPIFQFLSSCDDPIVNMELAQLLLCLLVEGDYCVCACVCVYMCVCKYTYIFMYLCSQFLIHP